MNVEPEYNARATPPADVARTFVPPAQFERLISRNHTLLLGPRGSGKTTLLKMLTASALNNWTHPQAKEYGNQITYNAAFVPADIAWGKQINAISRSTSDTRRKDAAFVIHTLRALVHAMREASELARGTMQEQIAHLAVNISASKEEEFVRIALSRLDVSPIINSLLGLELALEARLDSINSGDDNHSFSVDSFPSKISLLVSAFNGIIGQDTRCWALLFDELEIAPTRIQSFLLSGLRSFDQRVIVKLALVPYMDDVGIERSPSSPQPLHDYQTVRLSYPSKGDAAKFSSSLFRATFERAGIEVSSLARLLGPPGGREGPRHGPRPSRHIPKEFRELADKDESFRKYISDRKLFTPNYRFTENNVAQDIRKVLPIVAARNFYIRLFERGRVVAERSRKSYSLFTGYPSIVEITEGNPRAILTCAGPLAQQYREMLSETVNATHVPVWMQSDAIQRVELLLTSLLQVMPLDIEGFEPGKGLLDFVDQIGRAFEDKLLKGSFAPDYVGTFLLDSKTTTPIIRAVGKALNAGGIVHVPNSEGGPDMLLRGLAGQRFRLSYALAARYRLLLTLGDRVGLSSLLATRGLDISQQSLF